MANREALRELQTRLASRLQAAREEGVAVSWLAVKATGVNYIFPLAQSGEIFPLASLQPVPYSQPWFLGVINLRGGLHGVVDLAGFVGTASRNGRVSADARVITLNAALEVNCALMVDSLVGLRNLASFASSVAPDSGAPAFFGNRYTDLGGDVWQEIDLRSLSQFPGFLNISA